MAASSRFHGKWLYLAPLALVGSATLLGADFQVDPLPVRDFGYSIGDRITREFRVKLPPRRSLEQDYLPAPGPIDEWLQLTSTDWQPTTSPDTYRLRVEYQVFKGVRTPESMQVPPVRLRLRGDPAGEIATPAWAFTLQPLIPTGTTDGEVVIRPPASPNPPDAARHGQRIALSLVGILLLLAIRFWLAWLNQRTTRPFALALKNIRALSRQQAGNGFDPRLAMQQIHRALDATAGHRLFASQLTVFLAEHRAYSALREDLGRFFACSERLFFSAPAAGWPDGAPANWVEELCRRCAEIEAGKT